MQIRSIFRLHAVLQERWSTGIPTRLARTGARRFEIDSSNSDLPDFIYDVGFTDASLTDASFTIAASTAQSSLGPEDSSAREQGNQSANNKSAKPALIVLASSVALAVVLAGLLFAFGDHLAPMTLLANKPSTRASDSQAPAPIFSSANKPCDLNLETLTPLADSKPRPDTDGRALTLIRDIVIGGERQQEISVHCDRADAIYSVRFSLSQGSWKAKSATPMGSHS
ncbi:MAG: hypothetical protein RJA35_307 [Actinomycetota bacterium]|jgi:hypothetical protein